MLLKNRQIAILFFGLFVVMVGFGIIIPILPLYARTMGATSVHLGFIMATFSFFQFIFAPIWGSISDRIGRKPVMIIGLVGYALAHVINGAASSLWMLFLSRVMGGVLSSAVLPTSLAYVSDVTGERQRGAGMGILGAAMGLGVIFGPSIGGLIAHYTASFRTPFYVAAAMVVLLIPLAWRFLPETLPRDQRQVTPTPGARGRLAELVGGLKGELAVYFVLAFLVSFAAANLEGIFSFFAMDRFGFGSREIGIIFTVIGIVSVVMQGVLVGPAINRVGENRLILLGLLSTALGFVLLTRSWNFMSLTLFVTINMAGSAFLRPSISSIVSKRTAAGQGATMGLIGSFDSLGRIVGPVLAGWLYRFSINLPYYVGAVLMLLAALIALPAFLRNRGRATPAV